jgi:dihydroorotase
MLHLTSLIRLKLNMELCFTEKIEQKIDLILKVKQNLLGEITPYHQINVLETKLYGFIYPHKRITHVALSTSTGSRDLLAMRGDDGGREQIE